MNFIKPLWTHQTAALEQAIHMQELGHPGYALFFEPRCGKTPVAINMLRHMINLKKTKIKTLIFCPPRVVPGWKKEFAEHSKIPQDQIILLKGSGTLRLKLFKEGVKNGAYIFITNYETLLMGPLFHEFVHWKCDFLVGDEFHRVKDEGAKRSKRMEFLANPREATWDDKKQRFIMHRNGGRYPVPYKMGLTGSPILKSLMDLYWQFRVLDGGKTFSYYDYQTRDMQPLSKRGFQMTYFTDRNLNMPKERYFPKWELKTMRQDGFDGLAAITEKIKNVSARAERKDVLELPPNEVVSIAVDMSEPQKKMYQEMKRDFITHFKDKNVVAELALTKTLRLFQITSGFVKTDEGQELYLPHNPKQDALEDLLTDILPSGKAVIWCVFKENYRQVREVCEKLKVKYVELNGSISANQQDANVLKFKNEEDIRVFIGHPESGGEGLNLSEARYIIFYSRNHHVKHWIQGCARNQSQDSQHMNTTTYNIFARGTVDQAAAEAVASTEAMAQQVYNELILKNILTIDCKLESEPVEN